MSANTTLILAAFFFLLGAAVMGLIWYLQNIASGNYRKGKRVKPDPNLVEVASLMRDKTTQDLVVTMNGNSFQKATELNPGQLRRIHFASRVLVKWLADTPPTSPTEEAASPTLGELGRGAALPAEPDMLPEDWIPAESAPGDTKPVFVPPFLTPETPQEVKPISTQLSDVVGGIINRTPPPPPPPEVKSIARQIDAILQEMIVNTPFAQRGISLNDGPDGSAMVTLDGNEYPGVKDVPDDEVRNLIRSAVVEWEKTSKFSSRG